MLKVQKDVRALPQIRATINYIDRNAPPARIYYVDPPKGEPLSTLIVDPREVRICDVRGAEDMFTLEDHGCCFPQDEIAFRDFENEEAIRRQCYPAIEDLARRITGIDHVVAFDYGIRRKLEKPGGDGKPRLGGRVRNIGNFAHGDFTPYSSTLPVRQFLGDDGERLLQRRYAIYNFWWPIHGPLHDYPLALCTDNSIAADDYVEIENIREYGPSPILGLIYNPAHRWFYKSGLCENEMLMFRTWDSAVPIANCVPHVAFQEPGAKDDVLPRASIEMRILAFHDA